MCAYAIDARMAHPNAMMVLSLKPFERTIVNYTPPVLLTADCPFLMRFTAAWVYVAMATAGVSLHEKSKEYETACDLLRQLLGGRRLPLSV